MKIKPFLLNRTAICTIEPTKEYPDIIYPRINQIYTVRDVIVNDDGIGLLLHEIHNTTFAYVSEIAFDKSMFTLILYNWEIKVNVMLEELYRLNRIGKL
ncbi:MAG: hypothetical protein EOO43_05785 [Flavobacterium sp.]|nr:MAG: hypothetical protein EOO43_05785 [Flavobacterium sp.]